MVKVPPYLKPGDKIGLLCPAGYMSFDKAAICIKVLQEWGYEVRIGKTLGGFSQTYFSGTDAERLTEFQDMLDDESVKAILCARGGYGIGRIIEEINFKKFNKKPKWIIGFSDVTVLHAHIHINYNIATLHAPMAGAFNDEETENEFIQSLRSTLTGEKIKYHCDIHDHNKKGEAIGELIGGNLSLMAHLTGTTSDVKTKGKILFLEDVGEYLYHIDRMFYQLKRSGRLNKLAGLIIGGFTEMKDTERPFGKSAYEIIRDVVAEYKYPVCYGFPVGHMKENYALKCGLGYKLKITKTRVTLEE